MVPKEGLSMPVTLSAFLVLGAAIALAFVLYKIRKGQVQTADAVFWFVLAAILVFLAVFPQMAFWCAGVLGIESPANFIFLCAAGILFAKVLLQSVEIAKLKTRLSQMAQQIALDDHERER